MTTTTVAGAESIREDAALATGVPTRTGVLALTRLAGIIMPALTGIIDLTLRARIP